MDIFNLLADLFLLGIKIAHALSCLIDLLLCFLKIEVSGIELDELILDLALNRFHFHTETVTLFLDLLDLGKQLIDLLKSFFYRLLQFLHLTTSSKEIGIVLETSAAYGTAGYQELAFKCDHPDAVAVFPRYLKSIIYIINH